MKKSFIATLFASLFLIGGVTSCNNTSNPVIPQASIELVEDERVNLKTDLDTDLAYLEGVSGLLTVTPNEGWLVDGVYQEVNGEAETLNLLYGQTDTYAFNLKAGVNTFGALLSEDPFFNELSIIVNGDENVDVTCSLQDQDLYVGQYGVFTFREHDGYRVTGVKQNGTSELTRVTNTVNDFKFFLEEGTNTFDIETIETKDLPEARISYEENPLVPISLDFVDSRLSKGSRGLIKFNMSQKTYVKDVKLNDTLLTPFAFSEKDGKASYVIELVEGENTLTFATYTKSATIKVLENPNILEVTSNLTIGETHSKYDEGILTIKCKDNFKVDKVIQNGFYELGKHNGSKNDYEFTLLEGENTFEILTKEYSNEYSDNGLLEGGNNFFDKDGVLSDDVDEKPTPGGIPPKPLPEYPNGKTIYFIDAGWWNSSSASTNIICYNEAKEIINSDELGVMMRHVKFDQEYNINHWKWVVDADNTAYVQFVRTGNNGVSDRNSRTDLLPLPDFKATDGFELHYMPQWYKDDNGNGAVLGFAKVKAINYKEFTPTLPEGYGIYTIYVKPNSTWLKELEQAGNSLYCYKFGTINEAWPGHEVVKDGENYKVTVDTTKYQNVIFAVGKNKNIENGNQTVDLKLDFDKFGKDATLFATISESKTNGKYDCEFSKYSA